MSAITSARKAHTFLAENVGMITVRTQQEIMGESDPQWTLKTIPEKEFNLSGEGNREVITHIVSPPLSKYQPLLTSGNQSYQVPHPDTGEMMTVTGDKVGRGCNIPSVQMSYGYKVRTSCLAGRSVTFGPLCILDLVSKDMFKPVIEGIWNKTGPIMKRQYARALLDDIITYGKYNFAFAANASNGLHVSVDSPYFPAIPVSGPTYGGIRQIMKQVAPYDWKKGAKTPGGCFQVMMGFDAIEWMIALEKSRAGVQINTDRTKDDGQFGEVTKFQGIEFMAEMRPKRGYVLPMSGGGYDFVEIEPTLKVAAEAEGFEEVPNPAYEEEFVSIGGDRREVLEVGFWLHPDAFTRESMGDVPTIKGQSFDTKQKFAMNTRMLEPWELDNLGCNKHGFFFGTETMHAYGFRRNRHELGGAFLYKVCRPNFTLVSPVTTLNTATPLAPITPRGWPAAPVNECEPCDRPGAVQLEPTNITCAEPFPTNGVGVLRFNQSSYEAPENGGTLSISLERLGGNVGAATVLITLTEGTATVPEHYGTATSASGAFAVGGTTQTSTFTWADGIAGKKWISIPLVNVSGATNRVFTATLSSPTGAALGSITTTTVNILGVAE